MTKQKNTYRITFQDGTVETFQTTRELTGVFGFKNAGIFDGYGFSTTTTKDPRKAFERESTMPGRGHLTDWHVAEFEKVGA